jgi:hypothetical protein
MDRSEVCATIEAALRDAEIEYERPTPTTFVAKLPGTRKLSTTCALLVGDHTVSVNAFVARHVDENHERVYRWLLERNARLSGIAFALDHHGDVYLVGRTSLDAVTPAEVDRLLGAVLDAADSSFNPLLEMGFATAIRTEWAWRVKRGESLANLEAFAGLIAQSDGAGSDGTGSDGAGDGAEGSTSS